MRAVPQARLALDSALADPDWSVRWGALRAQARARGLTERRVLADRVAEAPAREEVLACLTAIRAAASEGRSTASFLEVVAAAQALASLGGPFAASALSQALSHDPDSHVQHVARRGLERLGFRPP